MISPAKRAECAPLVCNVAEWIWRKMKVKRRIEEAGTGTPRKKESERKRVYYRHNRDVTKRQREKKRPAVKHREEWRERECVQEKFVCWCYTKFCNPLQSVTCFFLLHLILAAVTTHGASIVLKGEFRNLGLFILWQRMRFF